MAFYGQHRFAQMQEEMEIQRDCGTRSPARKCVASRAIVGKCSLWRSHQVENRGHLEAWNNFLGDLTSDGVSGSLIEWRRREDRDAGLPRHTCRPSFCQVVYPATLVASVR